MLRAARERWQCSRPLASRVRVSARALHRAHKQIPLGTRGAASRRRPRYAGAVCVVFGAEGGGRGLVLALGMHMHPRLGPLGIVLSYSNPTWSRCCSMYLVRARRCYSSGRWATPCCHSERRQRARHPVDVDGACSLKLWILECAITSSCSNSTQVSPTTCSGCQLNPLYVLRTTYSPRTPHPAPRTPLYV